MEKTPRQLADERLKISDNYAKLGKRKVELMYLFAEFYNEERKNHKSDASVERAWDMTEFGLELMMIKEKMKSQEHRLSALRTAIEVAENERKNQY